MLSLSERDLGHVEKLFNIAHSLLEYDRVYHHPEGSAVATSLAPSTVLLDHQKQVGRASVVSSMPENIGTIGATSGISQRRLWTELAFLMRRVMGLQKLSLVSHVASDPGQMVLELARTLLTFLKESCAAVTGSDGEAKMRHVALLAQDRVLSLLRVFCSLKNCTIMLSEVSACDSADMALKVFNAICGHIVSGEHLSWMSQIYVWFCDEAARRARCGSTIKSAHVYATHDVLRCILGCCSDHEACAKAFLYSEPVACVTYMFYGLKLRIAAGDPLRPYEDEHTVVEKADGATEDAIARHAIVTREGSQGHSDVTPLKGEALSEPQPIAMHASPIPRRPPGAGFLKTRYFNALTPLAPQQYQRMPRDVTSVTETNASVALLVHPASSSPSGDTMSSSRAFNLPGLSRPQLKALLLGGRENAFDALLFSALDAVIEAIRVTRDYKNCMVLSTVGNLLLLSRKTIDVGDISAPSASVRSSTSASEASPRLSQVVAMHENILVLFQFLFSLVQGMGTEKPARPALERTTPAPSAPTLIDREQKAMKGDRKGTPPLSGLPSPSRQPCVEAAVGTSLSGMGQPPVASAVKNTPKDSSMSTTQLQEVILQQIVHMVLQTDIHAVLMATKRVLECDQTLFFVLHSFCMLDTQEPDQVEPPKKSNLRGSFTGAAAARPRTPADESGQVSVADAAASFFVTSSFGDLRDFVSEMGVNGGLDGGVDKNGGTQNSSRIVGGTSSGPGNGLEGSGTLAPLGSVVPTEGRPSSRRLQHPHREYEDSGTNKARKSVADGSGKNFALSFFKSFFRNHNASSGAVPVTHGVANADGGGDAGREMWGNPPSYGSSSTLFPRDGDGSSTSNGIDTSEDDDPLSGATGFSGRMNSAASPPLPRPRVSRSHSLSRQQNSGSRRSLKSDAHHSYRWEESCSRRVFSPWCDVPSFTALVRELVFIFNLVWADADLGLDVRLGAGLLLPSVVLRDKQAFRLYEGHALIGTYLKMFLHELQYHSEPRRIPTSATEKRDDPSNVPEALTQEEEQSTRDSAVASTSGRAHLTQRELITFASGVIEALEQTYKVLGVTPLGSEVASLTELPLYFYCGDAIDPLGVALEGAFTRVIVLWLIALVGAQCDEDVDRHAMEVLLHLMSRAVGRGSLPMDSNRTLVVTSPTTANAATSSGATWAAFSLSADQANRRRDALLAELDDISVAASSPWKMITTTDTLTDALREGSMFRAVREPPRSAVSVNSTMRDAENKVHCSHSGDSSLGVTHLVELTTASGVGAGLGESRNTVKALSLVFRSLLSRSDNLLSPSGLSTVLALFTSHDSNLSRLGRECMTHSLETPSVYLLYADVILDSDTFLLTETLSVFSSYLTSVALTAITKRERRLWMQRYGCVDAVIRVLVRIMESPQSTPNFMNVTQHIFEFLSAFEPGDRKPPQLSTTNFIASVTERLARLEGTEYFIIVTQAVLDASISNYGGAGGRLSNARNPGAPHTGMQVLGGFHLTLDNCAVRKPIFLELFPSLLAFAQSHSDRLFTNLVDALVRVLECTGSVHSERLASFALEHKLTRLLPYLELPRPFLEERLPFTGTAADLHSFWQPILLHAPQRSELRFTSHGGVQVSMGMWPDAGFSISAWFKFDRLRITVPLFDFHGPLSEGGGGGGGAAAVLRGPTIAASLFVIGGDSVQLTINDGRRVTVNENQALHNFCPKKWLHACAVLRPTHVLDVYVSGFKVGSTAFPYFAAGAEVRVNVGCTDEALNPTTSLDTDACPLFFIGDIVLWAQALSRSQVEAELASNGDGRRTTTDEVRPGSFPAKILEEGIPQELTLFRQIDVTGGTPAPGSAGNATNFSFGGLGLLMNPKQLPTGSSGAAGPSFAATNGSTTGASGDSHHDVQSAFAARMGRFVPYENEENLLQNVLAYPRSPPVVAKLVGQFATPPKTWVDYRLLWASRGGIVRMLDWMHLVSSSAELEGLLELIFTCVKRTTLAVTLDPRTYLLFSYMLTNHAACYMTNTACDQLLDFASSQINVFDQEHRIIINRLAFEHVLGDARFYAALRLNTALYLLHRVQHFFQPSHCRYAKHNARFVSPDRFIDGLLHSLIAVASKTSPLLRRAVVQVAQQVVVACDMEDGLVQIFVSLIALLTPAEMTTSSRRSEQIKVSLPVMGAMSRGTFLPLRTANHLATLLLSSLLECSSQSSCVSALSHSVDLPWYAACVSRFADPAAVLYATRIFFKAVQHNPVLQDEVARHQSAVVEALTVHAVYEDLILLMLALTMGTANHIDVLSHKHSLHQQLDSLLNSLSPDPNTLVAPIFVQLLTAHIQCVVQSPWQRRFKAQAVLHDQQRLAYRVRRYLSLVRVCSRFMILIRVRRYRAFLIGLRPPEANASAVEVPIFGVEDPPPKQICETVNGAVLAEMLNAAEEAGSRTGVMSTAQPPTHIGSYKLSRNDAGVDGTGCYGDGDDLPGDPTPLENSVGQSHLVTPPASVGIIDESHHDSRHASLGSIPSEWKPPVLFPDMWVALPSSTSATEAVMSVLSTPQTPETTVSHCVSVTPSLSRKEAPSNLGVLQVCPHPMSKRSARDAASGNSAMASALHAHFNKGKDYRVHSHKHRRAFAALRVCVLLWLPLQVRRCGWIYTPHASIYEEEFHRRHSGTLFCIQMLQRFASMSSYFYLFVNSPIQTAALSSLVQYISNDMLQEEFDQWDQVVRSMMAMPVRNPIEATVTATAPALTTTVTPNQHQQAEEDGKPELLTRSHPVYDSEESADDTAENKSGTKALSEEKPRDPLLDSSQRLEGTDLCILNRTETAVFRSPRSHSDGDDVSAIPKDTQRNHEDKARSSLPLPRLPCPSSTVLRGAQSPSTLLSYPSHQGGDQVDEDVVDSDRKQQRALSEDYGGSRSDKNIPFDVDRPHSPEAISSPQMRRLEEAQVAAHSPQQPHETDAPEREVRGEVASEAAAILLKDTKKPISTTHAAMVGPDDSSTVSETPLDAHRNVCDDDDGTSSVSSASSHASTVSSNSTAVSMLPLTLEASKEAASAPFATSNLPAAPAAQRGHDPSDMFAVSITKLMMSVGEVVRRNAVTILSALISSSLHTLPVPHWIGGPTYGSCGGLLFQLLFIVSIKAASVNWTNTLVRYFLLCVGNAVKEQRDCDLLEDAHHGNVVSPLTKYASTVPPPPPEHVPVNSSDALSLATAASTGAPMSDSTGGPPRNVPLSSATASASSVLPSVGFTHAVGGGPHSSTITGLGGNGSGGVFDAQYSDAPRRSKNCSTATTANANSDVFLLNLSRFTELIVDMLTINVLDLPMATHFFLTLLVLCQGWPSRYVKQLSGQVMRACIAVLNRPSTQDASVSLIESVYTLTTLVLRRGWKQKGVLESLLRVLYRIFVSLPPAWMSDADARHRKRLIALIFRHLVQTYAGTKELGKALTVRTLTQRFSLYNDFVMIFSLGENECCATFEQYCIDEISSLDTLMSGRPKAMADLAFKASIKTRSEYIKRVKAFNAQYLQSTEVAERYRGAFLRAAYVSHFSSFVDATPRVDASQLHWLLSATVALHENAPVAHARPGCMSLTVAEEEKDQSAVWGAASKRIRAGEAAGRTLFHFMDPQMNYGELKCLSWGEERASQLQMAEGAATTTVESDTAGQRSGRGFGSAGIKEDMSGCLTSEKSAPTWVKATTAAAKTPIEDQLPKNDLVRAAQCEELVQHIAALIPPFSTHCRPHIGNDDFAVALKGLSITLTPSAMTLLRYLVAPHETVRFLSNGFRINGIHATPCLILLTNVTLKLIGLSRVTEVGDIILCEHEVEDDDAHSRGAASERSISDYSRPSLTKPARKKSFGMSSMTKQLRKLFEDNPTKRRQQQDGTRVAQAVRQVIGYSYQNIYWTYLVSSIRAVRSLHYMHLDTAVQLYLYHDNGPMLSVVDAKQSMNPSARKEFIKVLKDVVGTQQCIFMGESQRAASLKLQLVRWATGSLSNFEYLRFLNETAGRTNRDLNQYPVFPWVLADYTSSTLDLGAPSTFRNFAYPMGAQTETRRTAVSQLFENTREVLDDESMGKIYPFHHGTHYSTSGGVLYFLIRVEPFTTYARLFQGGDFDLAARLFDSVSASFTSCVTGPADCKELIPEFYANSGFLANADHLNFGIKSDGEAVDDVHLPPWAKNSRQVFTAVMRYALECPYVVEHLHQWIDLVFGVRRRGPLAMERQNVFQRMTYGEEVVQALKHAETAHDCDVIIAEVDNFGQTPLQLFQERHPSHHELTPVVKTTPPDGGGGGALAWSDGHSSGRAIPVTLSSALDRVSTVTLGELYNSATTGTGSQLGATFSNIVSAGSFASGQTYTQAFCREAPKVMRMLIHAMDETQTWFVLRDPPSSVLQHPPPPALTDIFRLENPAVLHFGYLRTPKKLACAYSQLMPVPDTDHYLCWHEREAHLMRCTAAKTAFHPAAFLDPRNENGACISAVAVGPRESVLLVATSSGTVYCLFPDDTGNGALQIHATLCYHHSPVTKIALDSLRHRAVTITHSAGEDEPILWRVQRSGCSFLCRLHLEHLLATATHALVPSLTQTAGDAVKAPAVVDVAIDTVSGNVVLATARSLLLFDNNGEPFGVGTLPSLKSIHPVDAVTLEDDNGDVGVAVKSPVLCVADITAVAYHQTTEWAAGTGFLLTGHADGSLSAWRTTRLPPHTVEPGRIAIVEYHTRLFSGEAALAVSATASGSGEQQGATTTGAGRSANAFVSRTAPLGSSSNSGDAPGAATGAGMMSVGCATWRGTGGLGCRVTAIYQEHPDVPTFLIGYANGAVRQLVFEDPMLASSSGGGGKDNGGIGCVGDERSQRR
ncbi:hypothetical protein JKF63_02310 [Porcisia hertigi]|uniref:BEACH domain-containing protein n=1 Tax=Porcisia hertigi TaxID=2761500 RepID=A0A836I2F5_9TRYP|nr:hypothetical protein JKF63_02310 [Porcisia hertigi]